MKIKIRQLTVFVHRNGSAAVVYDGSRRILPFAVAVSIFNKEGRFDPTLFNTVGDVRETEGWTVEMRVTRKRECGGRLMRAVIGGLNPQPIRWS